MLGTLIESARRGRRHAGASGLFSLAFHVGLGAGVIRLTHAASAPADRPRGLDAIIAPVFEARPRLAPPRARIRAPSPGPDLGSPDPVWARLEGRESLDIPVSGAKVPLSIGRWIGSIPGPAACFTDCDRHQGSAALPLPAELVDEPARAVYRPEPVYPVILRVAGVTGAIVVELIVDTTGLVEPESIRVLESTHPELVRASRAAIERWRFVPAVAGGRHVRQLVRQRLVFRLG